MSGMMASRINNAGDDVRKKVSQIALRKGSKPFFTRRDKERGFRIFRHDVKEQMSRMWLYGCVNRDDDVTYDDVTGKLPKVMTSNMMTLQVSY